MIRRLNSRDIAREAEVTIHIGNNRINVLCTPNKIRELAAGIAATKFRLNKIEDIKVCGNTIYVSASRIKEEYSNNLSINLEEIKDRLKIIDINEYKRTRGYHVSAIIKNGRCISLNYDVSRHACLAKTVGEVILKNESLSNCYIIFSGRISSSIVKMCKNAGIKLIVSKAAIFDLAIELCIKYNISAVSFASGVIVGDCVTTV